MLVDESLKGPYTRMQEVQERFLKRQESARDLANYFVCKHNLYMALAVQQDDPKIKRRYENRAQNAMHALSDFELMEQTRGEDEHYEMVDRVLGSLSEN